MRRKTLSINASAVLLSTILLAKLIVDLVNKKKKVEEIYLELVCTIGIFLLCVVTAVFLTREKKEYKGIEHSGFNLSLDNSDEKVEEEERQPLLKRSASCPGQLNDKTVPIGEVRNTAEKIKSTMVKGDISEADIYYNLTGQQANIKHFGQDESIIAITLPENYSIKKYREIGADKEETIQNTKNSIIDDGDKYKPVDFRVNKIKTTNDKGKKENSYQFTFKFQNMQKDDVYIEINCETLNVYSGWKKNEEKPVTQYFKDLKANDDFLIFLDVKEVFSGFLGTVLTFAQKVFPANDQGLSSTAGKNVYEYFKLNLLQEKSSYYIDAKGKGILSLLNKKFPIKDILVGDQLIHKEQEVKQERAIAEANVQSEVVTDEKISNLPQLQNKEDEINPLNVNSAPSSPSTSSGIASDNTSNLNISDNTTTELKEEGAQKQPVSRSSSKNSLGSQGSIDSAGKQKKKLKEKAANFRRKVKDVFTKNGNEAESEGSIDGDGKPKKKFSFKKMFVKNSKKSEETSPSPYVSASSVENAGGIENPSFAQGE